MTDTLIKTDERKILVEKGLKQFHQSDDMKDLLVWLLTEQERVIIVGLQKKIKKEMETTKRCYIYKDALDWVLSQLPEEEKKA